MRNREQINQDSIIKDLKFHAELLPSIDEFRTFSNNIEELAGEYQALLDKYNPEVVTKDLLRLKSLYYALSPVLGKDLPPSPNTKYVDPRSVPEPDDIVEIGEEVICNLVEDNDDVEDTGEDIILPLEEAANLKVGASSRKSRNLGTYKTKKLASIPVFRFVDTLAYISKHEGCTRKTILEDHSKSSSLFKILPYILRKLLYKGLITHANPKTKNNKTSHGYAVTQKGLEVLSRLSAGFTTDKVLDILFL